MNWPSGGYIVVPIFAKDTSEHSLEKAIKSENFDDVALVLNALLEQDEELVEIIRELKEAKGKGEVFDAQKLKDKIELIGPSIRINELANSIYIEAVNRLGKSWDELFGLLIKFINREGHCLVPQRYVENGIRLGQWVSVQRQNKNTLSKERQFRLNEIGFVWDQLSNQWEEGYRHLINFNELHGHTLVPKNYLEKGYKLGQWIGVQRASYDILSQERKFRLNELGFIWDTLEYQWQEGFTYLVKFKELNGHCLVPQKYLQNNFKLGYWVSTQRQNKDAQTDERKLLLDELGFIWDQLTFQWEEGFSYLLKFKKREGHCNVLYNYLESGYKLGRWVTHQRSNEKNLTEQRKNLLNEIGFIWKSFDQKWEEGFNYLVKFYEREGHCKVPNKYLENDFKLGFWVSNQRARTTQIALSEERKIRLSKLGFVWDRLNDQWEDGFSYLVKFKEREGHCRVLYNHLEDNYKLGGWVIDQRKNIKALSDERKIRLDELGFIWNQLAAQWENGFSYLITFNTREGHCKVPHKHLENGFTLGLWVSVQRRNKENLSDERIKRLNSLNFIWTFKS